ncbi:MAG: hypothetical protein ACE5HF_05555 [Gemmatimonadota bacterium]
MHAQLEILLELQDLQGQESTLTRPAGRDVEARLFALQADEALAILREKMDELADRLDPSVRGRYEELAGSVQRAVAPVLNGICYGCFVAVPTAWSSEAGRNEHIRSCPSCGRFLYYVD